MQELKRTCEVGNDVSYGASAAIAWYSACACTAADPGGGSKTSPSAGMGARATGTGTGASSALATEAVVDAGVESDDTRAAVEGLAWACGVLTAEPAGGRPAAAPLLLTAADGAVGATAVADAAAAAGWLKQRKRAGNKTRWRRVEADAKQQSPL